MTEKENKVVKTQRLIPKIKKPPVRSVWLTHKTWNLHNPNNKKIKNDGYVIHHKDGKWWNNEISNLQKMTKSEHMQHHAKIRIFTDETKKKMSDSMMGRQNTLGHHHTKKAKKKISKAMKGKQFALGAVRTEEFKQNVSKFQKGRKLSEEAKENMRKVWVIRKLKKLQNG